MTLICPSKTVGKAAINCSVTDEEVPMVAALTLTVVVVVCLWGLMEIGTVENGVG